MATAAPANAIDDKGGLCLQARVSAGAGAACAAATDGRHDRLVQAHAIAALPARRRGAHRHAGRCRPRAVPDLRRWPRPAAHPAIAGPTAAAPGTRHVLPDRQQGRAPAAAGAAPAERGASAGQPVPVCQGVQHRQQQHRESVRRAHVPAH